MTNGVYQVGMRELWGETNRVVVIKPLTIKSVNGPALTVINGAGEMRCVYLVDGVVLTGFTLTNGLTENYLGGGAVGGVLNNC